MTLVILAAGMGSRYGGMKQIDPIGPLGEFIIDYSCHDAVCAGVERIVFVIKKENLEIFRETVGRRVSRFVRCEYVFQDPLDLPEGFVLPEGRVKPWGTAHAVLAARHVVDDPFVTINADDFYGPGSYRTVVSFLGSADRSARPLPFCMAGYMLRNTLTDNGSVSRGICETLPDGTLSSITERTAIYPSGSDAYYVENGERYPLAGSSVASMNLFGLQPEFFDFALDGFRDFLGSMKDPLRDEYYLPFAVTSAMKSGFCTVTVCPTAEKWYGVTYSADKESVQESIRGMIAEGRYSSDLWSDL
jgi:NDP-sugar pyrophosphorylase family protein